jgi:hypothetical protein
VMVAAYKGAVDSFCVWATPRDACSGGLGRRAGVQAGDGWRRGMMGGPHLSVAAGGGRAHGLRCAESGAGLRPVAVRRRTRPGR